MIKTDTALIAIVNFQLFQQTGSTEVSRLNFTSGSCRNHALFCMPSSDAKCLLSRSRTWIALSTDSILLSNWSNPASSILHSCCFCSMPCATCPWLANQSLVPWTFCRHSHSGQDACEGLSASHSDKGAPAIQLLLHVRELCACNGIYTK